MSTREEQIEFLSREALAPVDKLNFMVNEFKDLIQTKIDFENEQIANLKKSKDLHALDDNFLDWADDHIDLHNHILRVLNEIVKQLDDNQLAVPPSPKGEGIPA